MTTIATAASTAKPASRAGNIALWTLQGLLGAFFLVAAAIPKLVGEATAVGIFETIGGDWFRLFIGVLELAGAIGLVIPRLAAAAGLGLTLLMVGATYYQVVVFGTPMLAITTVTLGVLAGIVAWARRPRRSA
ncbi:MULTISPECIES: DoxX family protein [unclassified Crossiella]|uniref:DoxX family protein n=1 Tax=unclassified Crossiella TaxID=2620835 RepID=UPI001FFFF047|nr:MULTISPECIES: DoxX family protein [unclassified Crossiella]MCK2239480.1 DoxX family protein [Crossiella sp. S99.2]MCK2252175.1 DoxX family protein [Crossiella sp. S99.1]